MIKVDLEEMQKMIEVIEEMNKTRSKEEQLIIKIILESELNEKKINNMSSCCVLTYLIWKYVVLW